MIPFVRNTLKFFASAKIQKLFLYEYTLWGGFLEKFIKNLFFITFWIQELELFISNSDQF